MRHLFLLMALVVLPFATQAQDLALTDTQKQTVQRLQTYLNDLNTLSAGFAQITSSGEFSDGKVFLSRPGKMRLTYNPPLKTEIVVRSGTIIYHDKEYRQVTYYPLNASPLGVLLQENLSLTKDVQIIDVAQAPGVIELTLVDREDPGMGTVTLVFSDKPLALRKWIVVDAQGIMTQVSLLNPVIGAPIEADKFAFVDPKYDQLDN